MPRVVSLFLPMWPTDRFRRRSRDAELAAVRDYFQVEDENGERYWVFRAGDGEDAATGSHKWFMHGIFG